MLIFVAAYELHYQREVH